MSLKNWFQETVSKVFKKEETVKSEETADVNDSSSSTVKKNGKEDETNYIQNERTNTMGKTSENIKNQLISIMIPVIVKLIEKELPKLLDKYVSPEKIRSLAIKGIELLKTKMKENNTEWDEILINPIISIIEELIGISAETNLQEVSQEIQKEITEKVVEKFIDSVDC